MVKYLLPIVLVTYLVSVAFAGEKFNSILGGKDFCLTIDDGTTSNASCKPLHVPIHTLTYHGDYYSFIGINWDYADLPANSINWTDADFSVPGEAINWTDADFTVPSDAINWTDQDFGMPAESINWTDAEDIVPSEGINWTDVENNEIQTSGINWEDVPSIGSNKVFCLNSSGDLSYCTSTVDASGECTCQ